MMLFSQVTCVRGIFFFIDDTNNLENRKKVLGTWDMRGVVCRRKLSPRQCLYWEATPNLWLCHSLVGAIVLGLVSSPGVERQSCVFLVASQERSS